MPSELAPPTWAKRLEMQTRTYPVGAVVAAGAICPTFIRVTAGWAYEMRTLPPDRRQLFSLLLPGDEALISANSHPEDVAVIALTQLDVQQAEASGYDDGSIPEPVDVVAGILTRDVARLRDQAVRLGVLDAQARISHFLLDLHRRLSELGVVRRDSFRAPLTQDLLAAALGLSVVHVNRSLQRMRRQGLLTVQSGRVTLHDIPTLETIAGLNTARGPLAS